MFQVRYKFCNSAQLYSAVDDFSCGRERVFAPTEAGEISSQLKACDAVENVCWELSDDRLELLAKRWFGFERIGYRLALAVYETALWHELFM